MVRRHIATSLVGLSAGMHHRLKGSSGRSEHGASEDMDVRTRTDPTLPAQRVYVYFNNDTGGAAVRDADRLGALLGHDPVGAQVGRTRSVTQVGPAGNSNRLD